MKFHVPFFKCGEAAEPHVLLQIPHHMANDLAPSKNAHCNPPLHMVVCDEHTIQLATTEERNKTPNEN